MYHSTYLYCLVEKFLASQMWSNAAVPSCDDDLLLDKCAIASAVSFQIA